jgi:phage-related protein
MNEKWTVQYYMKAGGTYPVRDFIHAIDKSAAAKFHRIFGLLEEYGIAVREPHVKSIHGHSKLKEIRVKAAPCIYRIIFFFAPARKAILLHGFVKKTEKTPPREIELAEQRMSDYIKRGD